MSRKSVMALAGAASTFAIAPFPHVQAAMRVCHPAVSSGLQEARSEQEAKALAISAWITAASAHGQAYTAWRLAAGKFLNCTKTGAGSYRCLARAEPCAISQVAPSPGGAWQPRKSPGVDG